MCDYVYIIYANDTCIIAVTWPRDPSNESNLMGDGLFIPRKTNVSIRRGIT